MKDAKELAQRILEGHPPIPEEDVEALAVLIRKIQRDAGRDMRERCAAALRGVAENGADKIVLAVPLPGDEA